LEPHDWSPEQNVRLLGFRVRNMGRGIAERVYGVVQYNGSASTRIFWNDSPKDQIDILPGPLNEYWFHVAKLKKVNESIERYRGCYIWSGPSKEYYEITVKLSWNYHGLRSLTRKCFLNINDWNESKIILK
jgi:hypothetical protein